MIKVEECKFTKADVVEITGVSPTTLSNWLQRAVGKGGIEVSPAHKGGTGNRRMFNLLDLYKTAVAFNLTEMNIPPTVVNEIISSEKFGDWVRLSGGFMDRDDVTADLIVLHRDDGQFFAQYLSGEAGKSYWDTANQHVGVSVKSYLVIRFPELVAEIYQRARELVLSELPENELPPADRNWLAMRRHQQPKAGADD